jgi:hypothetical protein
MMFIKTPSLAIISGLMMIWAASVPAWTTMTGSQSINADVVSANSSDSSPYAGHNWLQPSAANAQPKAATCRPRRIFSQHDVVGDPESCIMQGAGYGLGAHGVVTSPAL